MNFSIPWFKNSWLKSPGLKSPGLELGVEKSRVEMSFNRFLVKKLKSSRNKKDLKKDLNDVTAAPFSESFFQLPTAKQHQKRGSCDVIKVLLFSWRLYLILYPSLGKGCSEQNIDQHTFQFIVLGIYNFWSGVHQGISGHVMSSRKSKSCQVANFPHTANFDDSDVDFNTIWVLTFQRKDTNLDRLFGKKKLIQWKVCFISCQV